MAKTVEEVLREMLGSQALQLAQLVAQNEQLREDLAKQTKDVPKETP